MNDSELKIAFESWWHNGEYHGMSEGFGALDSFIAGFRVAEKEILALINEKD